MIARFSNLKFKSIGILLLFLASTFVSFSQLDTTFTSPDPTQCPSNLFTINANTTTYTTYSWLVTGPSFSQTFSGSSIAFFLTTAGSYTVKLTVGNGVTTNTNTVSNYLTVYSVPVISYSLSATTGCSPLIVTFNGSCTPGSGTLSTFSPNSGDGSNYTTEDFSHTYNSAGTFTPSVTVINSFGCITTGNLSAVTVKQSPSLTSPTNPNSVCSGSVFSYTPTATPTGCTFTWTRAAVAGISQAASSGSGNISETLTNTTASNINVIYVLTITGTNGCVKTQNVTVSVRALPTVTISPATAAICSGQTLTLTAAGSATGGTYTWSPGGATTSTRTVTTAGTYSVVYSDGTCASASVSRTVSLATAPTVTIGVTESSVTANDGTVCSGSNVVLTANPSTAGGTYAWSTGATSSSITVAPTVTTAYTLTYTYVCASSPASATITVNKNPVPTYTSSNSNSCSAPATTVYTSTATAGQGTITATSWSFPSGSPSSSLLTPQSVNYLSSGNFSISQTITNSVGCTATTTFPNAMVVGNGTPPTSTFTSLKPLTQCIDVDSVKFKYTGTGADTIKVDWGDGLTQYFDNLVSFSHKYATCGTFTVTLTPYKTVGGVLGLLGCAGAPTTYTATIKGPKASFTASTINCSNQISRTFTSTACGTAALTIQWQITNTSPVYSATSTSATFPQTFPSTSATPYKVVLTATDLSTGCAVSKDSLNVYALPNNLADFRAYTTTNTVEVVDVCIEGNLNFINTTPAPQYNPNNSGSSTNTRWDWKENDGLQWPSAPSAALRGTPKNNIFSTAQNVAAVTYTPGTYGIAMVNIDLNGCRDTVVKTNYIKVHGITGTFSVSDTVCANTSITVTDNSVAPVGSIVSRVWSWGDGTANTTGNVAAPTHTYTSTGLKVITLTATDDFGCTKTSTDTILVRKPLANFSVDRNYVCNNQTVTVTNASSGIGTLTYAWLTTGATPVSSTLQNPGAFTFTSTGSKTIKLTVTETGGCSDDTTLTITVNDPFPNSIATPNFVSCFNPPTVVNFTNTSSNNVDNTSAIWNFNALGTNGQTSTNWNPSTVYSLPGTYVVSLTVSSLTGCTATRNVDTVTIGGPFGSINVNNVNLTGCSCYAASITVTTSAVTEAKLLYGDGQFLVLTPNTTQTVNYSYCNTGGTTVTMNPSLYISNGTCNGFIPASQTINIKPTPTVTAIPNQVKCAGTNSDAVVFTGNVSSGVTYTWSNSNTTTGLAASGTGDIASFVTTNTTLSGVISSITVTPSYNGCTGTPRTFTITVGPRPVVSISSTSVCVGGTVTVTPATSANGSWSGNNNSVATISAAGTVSVQPGAGGNVTFTYTETVSGCTNTVNLTVNPKPTVTGASGVCVGSTITLSPTTGGTWASNASPIATVVPSTGVVTGVSTTAPSCATFTFTNSTTGCTNTTTCIPVNPLPTVTLTPSTVCQGVGATATPSTLGTWVSSNTGVAQITNAGVITTPTVIASQSTATFTYTLTSTGCSKTTSALTVNPLPVLTAPASVCIGTPGALTPTTGGTWTSSNTSVATVTNAGVITGLTAGTVTFTFTQTSTGCSATTASVSINATPVITNMTSTVCSGTAFSVTPVNGTNGTIPTGTTYTWSAPTATGITGTAAGTAASLISGTLTNTTSSTKTVAYTVTPTLGSCAGTPFTVTVTVNPKPSVAAKTATICSTNAFTVSPTDGSGSDIVPTGTTYTWTVTANNNVNGESAQATGQTNISQTLTGNASVQTVNYTVTPTSGTCVGSTFPLTVTVNPIPTFTAAKTDPTSCGATNGTITLSGLTASTSYQVTYVVLGVPTSTPRITDATGKIIISSLSAGSYTVSVTLTSSGCQSATQVVTLTNPGAPDINDITDQVLCGGSYTLPTITGTNLPGNQAYYSSPGGVSPILTGSISTSQTVYIYGISSGGCSDQESFTVTINTPAAIPAKTATICSGGIFTVTPVNVGTEVVPAGTTYSWAVPVVAGGGVTGLAAGTASSNISGTLVNSTNAVKTVVYTVTPTSGTCSGSAFTVTVTLNPVPALTDMTATACSATAFSVTPANTTNGIVPSGTTYTWAAPTTTATGGSAQATGQTAISQTLTNITTTSTTATYTVTPTFATCVGTSFQLVVTVNPTPVITNKTSTICSGATFTVTPTNGSGNTVPTGTTYSWSAPSVTGITGTLAGTVAPNISGTLTNTTNSFINVVYVVTPTVGSCSGATFNVTVRVNPTPAVTPMTASACSGNAFSVTPANTTNGIVPSGTTYTWAAPVVTDISGTTAGTNAATISGTLTHSTSAPINVPYTITPKSGTCTGTDFTLTVTVNPNPAINAMTATVCSGTSFTVTPTDVTNGLVPAGTTYTWVTPTATGITGGAAGTGVTNINGTLVNTTSTAKTIVYTVTPGLGTCSGAPFTVTVTVNPKPTIAAKTATICSTNAFTVSPTDGTGGDIVPTGTTYTWTVVSSPVIGESAQATAQTNISQTLTTPSLQTVNYTVTPTSGTCVGSTFALAVTVNPLPTFTATKTDPTTCNGTNGVITLSGLANNTSYLVSYTLSPPAVTATLTSNASGQITLSNLGAGTYDPITVTLVSNGCQSASQALSLNNPGAPNITDIADQVLCGGSYTLPTITGTNLPTNVGYFSQPSGVSPILTSSISTNQTVYIYGTTSGGCSDQESFTVTINTVPSIAAKTATICSNGIFTVTPSNTLPDVVPTGTTYSWSAPNVNFINGEAAGSSTTNISGTLENTTNAPINVVYSVTPTANSCPGTPFNVTVTVNPQPAINDMTATACNATAFNVTPANNTNGIVPTGTTYVWSAPTTTATGGSAQATAQTSISQTLTHTSASAVTASYIVTPTSGTCVGTPFTLVVTVSPRPVISNESTTICSAGTFAVTPASGGSNVIPTGTTYSWAAPVVTGISGTTSGTGLASIGGTLTNSTNEPINVSYVVTPSIGGCAGATFNVTVTVEPTPALTPMLEAICTDNSFSITPVNTTNGIVPSGTTYTWAAPTTPNISGATSGTNSPSVSGTLTNTTNAGINVVYTVTPTSGTCVGSDFPLTVTVNPIPAVTSMTATASTGVAFSVSPQNTTNGVVPGGTTYTWALPPTPTGITGTASGSSQPSISGNLTNTTNSGIDVVYTVTPVIGNCTGAPFSVTVTVLPRPTITAKTVTICSGETFSVCPVNGVNGDIVPLGTTYTWTVTNNPIVSGDLNQISAQNCISQTLTSGSTTTPQIVVYVVTPTSGPLVGNTFTLTVTVNPVSTFTTTKTDPTACNGTDGTITLVNLTPNATYNYTIIGGSLPFTVSPSVSSNASGQIVIPNLGAGNYTITVINSTNCESTPRTVTLNNPGAPNVNDIVDVLVCGTSYTLPTISGTNLPTAGNGTAGFFSSTNGVGQLTGTITSPVASTQTVYIYAATLGGCSDEESFVLTINPVPVVNVTTASVCVNETITLTATSSGASTVGTWSSSNSTIASVNAATGVVTGHTAGTVSIFITETGTACQSLATSVTVKALPTVTAGPNQTICSNSSATLAGVLGGSATAGVWSGGAGTFNPTNTTVNATYTPSPTEILAGTVTLALSTVDTAGICSSVSSNVTITIDQLPTINAGLDQTICSSSTATLGGTLGGSATTATWSSSGTANTVFPSNALNATYTPPTTDLGPIVLTLTSNDPSGPCPAVTSTVTITVNPKATLNAGADFASCNGSSIQLAGTTSGSATSGTWSTPGNLGVFAPNSATGIYTPTASEFANPFLDLVLTTDDPIGPCPAVTDTVRVSFSTPATANAGPDQTICSGLPVNVTGSYGGSASSATWVNFGGTISPSINISPITYTYTPSPSEINNNLAILVVKTNDPAGPCLAVTDTVLIHINPTPFLLASNQFSSCTNTSVNIPLVVSGGLTSSYVWTVSDNANILGESVGQQSSDTITDVLVNLDPVANQSVIYHVTPTIGSCVGTPVDITVTVLPRPIMNPVADQMLCANTTTQLVIFDSNIPSTNFAWTSSLSTVGIATTGNGNIPAFTAINNSGVTQIDSLCVIPTTNLGTTSCAGNTQCFKITVLPISTVNDPVDQVICAGQSTAAVIFTGSDPFTDYNWISVTPPNSNIGLAASGSGNILSFVGVNNGTVPIVATVTVTPSLNGCLGTPQTFTITVKPLPVMQTIADRTVCIGNVSNTITFNSIPNGTTYVWTATHSITTANGGTGIANGGTTNFIPSFTATNITNHVDTSHIIITPTFNGCAGTPVDFNIFVNPILQADPIPNAVLCEGDLFPTITITGNAPNVTYSWHNDNIAIGLQNDGLNIISGFPVGAGNIIDSAHICITPLLTGCQGIQSCFTITVKPKPNVLIPQNLLVQSICHNALTQTVPFTGDVLGTTFTWENMTNMSIQTGSTLPTPSAQGNSLPSFNGQNTFIPITANDPVVIQTALYNVTPTANGCSGDPGEFTITVNPVPTISPISNQTVCAGVSTTPVAITGNFGTQTTYSWTNSNIPLTPPVLSTGTNSIQSFTPPILPAVNRTDSTTFVITPNVNGCFGQPTQFRVYVKPIPTIFPLSNQSLCAGDSTTLVNFIGNMDVNLPSDGVPTYEWYNDNTSIGLASNGLNDILPFMTGGTGVTPATIKVIPKINGCFGDTTTFTITTVNPKPNVFPVLDQVLCAGTPTNAVCFAGSNPVDNFAWSVNTNIGIASNGNANPSVGFCIPSFNTISPLSSDRLATFKVVPQFLGCSGDTMSFTMLVRPVPDVLSSPIKQILCAGQSTTPIIFNNSLNLNNVNYNWTNNNTSIGLTGSGSGDILTFTPPTSVNIDTAIIICTPELNGCFGLPKNDTIVVNPIPSVVPTLNVEYCDNVLTNLISFSGSNALNSYHWINLGASIGLPSSAGIGNIDPFTTIGNPTTDLIATIEVTPFLNGCPGDSNIFTIKVKPVPVLNPIPDQILCSGQNSQPVIFTGTIIGSTTYNWLHDNTGISTNGTIINPSSATGIGAGIPSFPVVNVSSGSNPPVITDTIIVTPSSNGCTGNSQTFTISVNPVGIITQLNDITVCSGESVAATTILGTSSAADYIWNHNYPSNLSLAVTDTTSGDPDVIPSFVATGGPLITTVPIVVTPIINGCPGIDFTWNITINPRPTVDPVQNQVLCANQSSNQVVFSGTVTGTTYTWTNSDASIGISGPGTDILPSFSATNNPPLSAPLVPIVGQIRVITEANNCYGDTTFFTITVNPLPRINPGFDTTLCLGQFVVPQVSWQSLGGALTPVWSANPSTAVTPVDGTPYYPNASTWLTVIGTDGNLCQNTDSLYVTYLNLPPPIVNAGIDTALCFGESIALCPTGDASVYVWDNGVFSCIPFTPLVTNTYIVTGSSVTTGCYTKDTIVVTVNPLPTVIANASVNPVCLGDATILYGSGADTYVWDNNVIDSVAFAPIATNTYTVIGTDINGCKDTSDIVVTVNPKPNVLFSSDMTYGGCLEFKPTFTDLTSPPSAQVTWLFGDNTAPSHTLGSVTPFYTNYGCYDVTLISTTAEGCTDSLTQQDFVCVNQIIADFDPDTFEQPISNPQFEFTNTSQNATSYEWFFGDGTGNNYVHTDHNYDSTGYYVVTLVASAQDGCTDTARITIKVRDEVILYVPNTFTPDENGLNDVFMPTLTAGYDREGVYEFKIYNRWGEQIFFTNQLFTGWDGTYKGEKVQIGTYNWSLRFKDSQNNKVYDFYGHVNLVR